MTNLPTFCKEALEESSPAASDKALVELLRRELRRLPRFRERLTFGTDGEATPVLLGVILPPMSEAIRSRCISHLEAFLSPMTDNEAIAMLTSLKLLTVNRGEQGTDLGAQIKIYAQLLREYPADIVRHVLKSQARMSKWWPAWSELVERLEPLTKKRKALLKAFKEAQAPTPPEAKRDQIPPERWEELKRTILKSPLSSGASPTTQTSKDSAGSSETDRPHDEQSTAPDPELAAQWRALSEKLEHDDDHGGTPHDD